MNTAELKLMDWVGIVGELVGYSVVNAVDRFWSVYCGEPGYYMCRRYARFLRGCVVMRELPSAHAFSFGEIVCRWVDTHWWHPCDPRQHQWYNLRAEIQQACAELRLLNAAGQLRPSLRMEVFGYFNICDVGNWW